MFRNSDGSPSITAGTKCAFNNLIFAIEGKGWTPAAKILASTYFDLSEKKGYAFARRKYLRFRTKLSLDTISTANGVIEASGLFSIEYRANNSLRVTPNPEAIEAAYQNYVGDHASFRRLEDEWWNPQDVNDEELVSDEAGTTFNGVDGESDEVDGNSDEGGRKTRRGSSENPSRNLSRNSLHRNPRSKPSTFHTRSDERVKRKDAAFGKARRAYESVEDDTLGQFIAELHKIVPDHEPFDGVEDRKAFDAERSRRGERPLLQKLILNGWTLREVREMVETYVKSARDNESSAGRNYKQTYKTLSAIFSELLFKTNDRAGLEGDDEFYGRRLPERLLRKSEDPLTSANDNWRPDRANVDGHG
ncbi:hypothetical protein [Bradyrhizobium japonicum]|uniref:hypothetical protein n=1 Tax=Bradyrhizobium japonicum TaxID=375 RepID=UPI00209E3607|nr:hypothetical protein [Bradyrhizobium japonicum]MCP1773659.1 hypothetical protein [Bradyrhizobium japonicum]MCP1963340.1 hypothetical protein [Bradyrhizobium japonicum]